ncbi:MAG: DUF2493 domain-containing protein [Clostridia bacterium]|nr:DUF2493 domain-containing protein [Clostridia bacterium]
MTKKLLIAGSREYSAYDEAEKVIDTYLNKLTPNDTVIILSGACRGADRIGERYAEEHGYEVRRYPADWKRYGRGAGPVRNRLMADEADYIICFWNGKSRGSRSLIEYAEKLGKKVFVISI